MMPNVWKDYTEFEEIAKEKSGQALSLKEHSRLLGSEAHGGRVFFVSLGNPRQRRNNSRARAMRPMYLRRMQTPAGF